MCSTRTATSQKLCNMAMVELEPVPAEEAINERFYHHRHDLETHGRVEILTDMTRFDAERLRYLYRPACSASPARCARRTILADWKSYWRGKFRKVMPLEYRRALKEMAAEQATRSRNSRSSA